MARCGIFVILAALAANTVAGSTTAAAAGTTTAAAVTTTAAARTTTTAAAAAATTTAAQAAAATTTVARVAATTAAPRATTAAATTTVAATTAKPVATTAAAAATTTAAAATVQTTTASAAATTTAAGQTTQKMVMKKVTTITGSMSLSVGDAAAFVADPKAKAGVAKGIAKAVGVPADLVTVTLSVATSRRLGSSRRLAAGGVSVSYSIKIPEDAPATTAKPTDVSSLLTKLTDSNSTEMAELASAVASAVEAEGLTVTLTVTGATAPESSMGEELVPEEPEVTTTGSEGGATSAAQGQVLPQLASLLLVAIASSSAAMFA